MIEATPLSLLPKTFDYYAGGHPHFIYSKHHENYGIIAYPGPIYPNNFQELEKLRNGGFYIIEVKDKLIESKHIPLNIVDMQSYLIDANNKNPREIEAEILRQVKDYKNKIITLRIEGSIKEGKVSDVNFKSLLENFKEAYFVLKNTSKLTTKDFQEISVDVRNVDDIESSIVKEHIKQSILKEDKIQDIMKALDKEKYEGEKNADFEIRIIKDIEKIIEL